MLSVMCQSLARNEKTVFLFVGLVVLMYFLVMDIILYVTIQHSTLSEKSADGHFHMFKPLTIKLIAIDHMSHYVITPTAELFDNVTKFSKVFYFISPNMISFTHIFIGLLSARFFYSDSLRNRRIAVLLFEVRTWLDALDGVVHRSHIGMKYFHANERKTMGYVVDVVSDTVSVSAMCFAILFYYFKWPPNAKNGHESPLPNWTKTAENGVVTNGEKHNGKLSKQLIFWKVFCYGILVSLAAGSWDRTLEKYSSVLQTKAPNAQTAALQTEALHSTGTFLILWLWRWFEGQTFVQMMLVAVFIDKTWEFINFIQYSGYVVVIVLTILSEIHFRHIQQMITV